MQRDFGTTINADVVIGAQTELVNLGRVAKINGNLIIQRSNITSNDLHELRLLKEVRDAFVIDNVPAFNGLFGLSKLQRVGALVLERLPLVTTLASFRNSAYSGVDIERVPALTTLN